MAQDSVVVARASDSPDAERLVVSRTDHESGDTDCQAWVVNSSGEPVGKKGPLLSFFSDRDWVVTRAGDRMKWPTL